MPTCTPCNGFRFLDLPTELRCMVYEFALTHEHGLFTGPDSRTMPAFKMYDGVARVARDGDPNPLRLVCRQLYRGTWGLLLGYNVCLFKGEESAVTKVDDILRDYNCVSGLYHFLRFVNGPRRIGTRFLKRVIIEYDRSVRDPADVF